MADTDGIVFMRTLRGKTPVRTPPGEDSGSAAAGWCTTATTWRSSPAASRSTRPSGGRGAGRRGHRGARDRLLLAQADRRRDACARRRASAVRSSPSRTTGPRAGSATPCSRRWPKPTTGARPQARRARDAGLGHARRADGRGRDRRGGDRRRRTRGTLPGGEVPLRVSPGGRNPRRGTIGHDRPDHAVQARCRCTVAAARLAVSACAAANGMSCLHFVPRAGSVSVFRLSSTADRCSRGCRSPYAVWPSPRIVSSRALPRSARAAWLRGTASPGRRCWRPRAPSATSAGPERAVEHVAVVDRPQPKLSSV